MPLNYDVRVFDVWNHKLPNATLIIKDQHCVDEEGVLCTTQKINANCPSLTLCHNTKKLATEWQVRIVALLKQNGDHSFRYKVKVSSYQQKTAV